MGDILTGLSVADATAAVIAAAGLLALVGFTIWGSKKVAGFFGR